MIVLITSDFYLKIVVGIKSAAKALSVSCRMCLMTSSVASGDKAGIITPDRTQWNSGGGESMVLECTLATFLIKKMWTNSTWMTNGVDLAGHLLTSKVSVSQSHQPLYVRVISLYPVRVILSESSASILSELSCQSHQPLSCQSHQPLSCQSHQSHQPLSCQSHQSHQPLSCQTRIWFTFEVEADSISVAGSSGSDCRLTRCIQGRFRGIGLGCPVVGCSISTLESMSETFGDMTLLVKPWIHWTRTSNEFLFRKKSF